MEERPYSYLEETEYDVIISGTGFTQSLIAAACSRIGKRVLHLDVNDYYGSEWASYNFSPFLSFIKQEEKIEEETKKELIKEESKIYVEIEKCKYNSLSNVSLCEKIEKTETNENELFGTELFEKESRKFNIDLSPRYVLSNGALVNLLVRSGVAQYLEFKALENTYLYLNIEENDMPIKEVPCSKSDVFKSKVLSLKDKRFLMKFLTFCIDYFKGEQQIPNNFSEESSFVSFLESQELHGTLQKFIIYSIAQVQTDQSSQNKEDIVTLKEGLEKMKTFLTSLGRFNSNTPYLVCLYGSSELVQAYCRLCAVFGGVYILRRYPKQLILSRDENNENCFEGIVCSEGQTLKGKYFVGNATSLTPYIKNSELSVSRAICISKSSLVAEKKTLLLTIPPGKFGNKYSIFVQQFDANSYVCPKDHFIFYLSTKSTSNAKDDLEKVVSSLFHIPSLESLSHDSKPVLDWFVYFNQSKRVASDLPKNVISCEDPLNEICFENPIKEANEIFSKMFPNEQFLPDKELRKEESIEGNNTNDQTNEQKN